ncbi:V-type ATP synthase subunit A [Halioxenophilus sp. WMMB6]|uniref:V-type ATP synthase subunit A n=1 Tax=Halioxenophilus sp. WMMB6 TaxID=3073815 RepID=UPI00295EBEDA|nr:V-type ATP synthase subunit A [Halioxenophilus sp. WMMB6]
MQADTQISARVIAVQDDLVSIESIEIPDAGFLPLTKNEVIFILPSRMASGGRQEYLKAEILRIEGRRADAQVYESTTGVGVGDSVVQTQGMLSAELGPGLLGMVYDGLQNPLEELAVAMGTFLPRGVDISALDESRKWLFKPCVKSGERVEAGDTLGSVTEGRFQHKIMAPFDLPGSWKVVWVQEGSFTVTAPVLELESGGKRQLITLRSRWPIRRSLTRQLTHLGKAERRYPNTPLTTTIRLIDTFFPIAKGGTGCIPGPFGAGKTVLQGLISRYSDVDIVIVVACGERAGEVVETIKEFPSLPDPKSGGTLMDRTIIICNTSSMPVAAREASIYTGITLGEYYQAMGYDVLLIADSTSRWAQAMRETSGRLEEIPGEEAFPAYLDSAIKGVYERAGSIVRRGGQSLEEESSGTLTMIGTVSPAGGNFEEPVTQSTLGTVKAFLGLSSDRAYRRFYPAVDPLLSWSRYLQQLQPWFEQNMGIGWSERIERLKSLLSQGDEVERMMQVTGEEGVTAEDFITYQQAQMLDRVYLQQDAFDPVDVSAPMSRQQALLALLEEILAYRLAAEDKSAIRDFYTRLTGLLKNLNYSRAGSNEYQSLEQEIRELLHN